MSGVGRQGEALARLFHETYERLAPEFGYKPRSKTSVPWDEVPEPNRSLMIAVAAEVDRVRDERIAELERAAQAVCRYHDGTPGQAAQMPKLRAVLSDSGEQENAS